MSTYQVRELRKLILEVAIQAGGAHVPSALSILDIIYVLYKHVLNEDQDDRFVLSKGHGCLALYAVLQACSVIDMDTLFSFGRPGSPLGGHPDRTKVSGAECSTGSLGHGLPQALGMALGMRLQGSPGVVYVLCGDGELNEGTMWESILIAPQRKLGNLCLVIDDNGSSSIGYDDLAKKFLDFGWHVYVCDGHHHSSLRSAFESVQSASAQGVPTVVIAKTIKGFGSPEMAADPNKWHRGTPTQEMLETVQ